MKKAAGLDIRIICPLHGPILKDDLSFYLQKYDIWSSYRPEDEGVLVAYASIHGNTAAAAKKFAAILEAKGAPKVVVCDLARCDMAEAVEDAFRYSRLLVCAPTYDAGLFPCMEHFLLHLRDKNYQNRTVGILENGSWAPMAGKHMRALLDTCKNLTICEPVVTVKSVMNADTLPAMEQLADALLQ